MTIHTPYPGPETLIHPQVAFVSATLRLSDPNSDNLVRHVRLLRDCVALAQQRWRFEIEAAAVLPSEMHILFQFQDHEFAVGGALKLIKSSFKRHLPTATEELWAETSEVLEIANSAVSLRRRFIESAPVRAGLVKSTADWPFSSVHHTRAQATIMGVEVA